MKFSQQRLGEIFILTQAALWGLLPVVAILSFNKLAPIESLAWSTFFSSIFFAVVVTVRGNWREVKNKSALKDILWLTFFVGLVFYVLLYTGLKRTSPGNAIIIGLTQVFFSYVLFHLWRKEFIPKQHITGAFLIMIGAGIVLYPNTTDFRVGDVLVLAAAFVAPFGNFFQQRARKKVSSETILFLRSLISSIVLLVFIYGFGGASPVNALKQSFWYLITTGVVLFGITKILWVEGIHRISVTKASALAGIQPVVTLTFAWLILSQAPTLWQIFSFVPMFFGIILLSKNLADGDGEPLG